MPYKHSQKFYSTQLQAKPNCIYTFGKKKCIFTYLLSVRCQSIGVPNSTRDNHLYNLFIIAQQVFFPTIQAKMNNIINITDSLLLWSWFCFKQEGQKFFFPFSFGNKKKNLQCLTKNKHFNKYSS